MNKRDVMNALFDQGLVPVVRVGSAEEALGAADALMEGGVRLLEITMSVPGALKLIEELSRKSDTGFIFGAGTVLDSETGRAAILSGAQFIVSPSVNADLIRLCCRYGAPVLPGAMTPTEIVSAWEAGADMVKVFPAAQIGGPAYIKAIRGPLPHIPLVPTGGVNLLNAGDFIKAGASALGVGGELVDSKAIKEGNLGRITQKTREYLDVIEKARGE